MHVECGALSVTDEGVHGDIFDPVVSTQTLCPLANASNNFALSSDLC